ncbi:MAG: SCO family protein [Woeseiaceae bacterium]
MIKPAGQRLLLALLAMIGIVGCLDGVTADEVISGNFELLDHNGQRVTEQSYAGKLRLVFFGFTRCPDVCPTTLVEVRDALRLLGDDAAHVQPLFVSVDSDYDSTQKLANYVAHFHASLVGLSGTTEQIDTAAESFNVTYGVKPAEESSSGREEIFHTSYLFLMDREGDFLDVFGYGTKAERIAKTLREYL